MVKENGYFERILKRGAHFVDNADAGLYLIKSRIAIHNNGDQIKYNENNEIEWVFFLPDRVDMKFQKS
jgi:hypothetical protein